MVNTSAMCETGLRMNASLSPSGENAGAKSPRASAGGVVSFRTSSVSSEKRNRLNGS
jgi:hypothetical protein